MRKSIREIKRTGLIDKPILLSGEETFFIDKAVDHFKRIAKKNEIETNTISIDSSLDLDKLSEETLMPSLFSEKSHYFIYFKQIPNAKLSKQLVDLLPTLPTTNHYAFVLPKLSSKQLKSKWINTFESIGEHYISYPLKLHEQTAWIKSRLAQLGLETTPNSHLLIAKHYEGNLHACFQAMEKLSLIYDKARLSEADIEKALIQESEYNVFECIDSCLSGQLSRAQTIINTLQTQKIEPVLILWAFLKELRVIAKIKFSLVRGGNINEQFRVHYVWQSKQLIYRSFLKRISLSSIYKLIAMAKEVDAVIKGLSEGDAWFAICRLLITLCQASSTDNEGREKKYQVV